MPSSLKVLIPVFLLLLSCTGLRAQDNDYLKHKKFFEICSIKKHCFSCYDCDKERYIVKLNNVSSKKIKNVYYKFYSPVFNKIVEKEAKIQGDKIEGKDIGQVFVCVVNVKHWIFSKIVYADESAETFVLHERMENFLQEADETDCND